MKMELRHCKHGCNCMTNHFIKEDGSSVCGKCGHITKSPKLPPGWREMFGLGRDK